MAVFALLVAMASVGLWGYTWWQSGQAVEYTADQQAAAKHTACAAYATVHAGVETNTNLAAPGGNGDVTGALAAAANARVALMGGGQYLLARIDPATPAELAQQLAEFGNALLDFGAAATAGALNTDPPQADLLEQIDGLNNTLAEACA